MTKKSRDRRVARRAKIRQRRLITEITNEKRRYPLTYDDVYVTVYPESYDGKQSHMHHMDEVGQWEQPKGLGVSQINVTGSHAQLQETYKKLFNI